MGQVIAGRFELASHIASGGSGSIWSAWDRRRSLWCAAKVLRHKDSGELLRFVREQGIQLDHPHLATPYGWAAEDEDVAIAMPLVAGGTLDTALKDHGAFSSALAAALLLQLLDGLEHVHAAGWIHRDVKPANILLEPTGEGVPHVRLGDFGIAVREDDPRFTSAGWVNGTPGYLAPEAMDLAAPAPAQDLYAAGVVALRMVDPSVRGERGLEAAVVDPRRTLAAVPGLDPRLAAVVVDLLDRDPDARVTAAAGAAGALDMAARPQTPAGGYLTAAGEPFMVFRQVEPGAAERSAGTEPPVPPLRPTPATPAVPDREPRIASPAQPVSTQLPAREEMPVARGEGHSPDDAGPAPTSGRRPGTGLGPWVLVGIGLVVLAFAVYLMWPRGEGGAADAPGRESGRPTSSVAAPGTPAPEASVADSPSSGQSSAVDPDAPPSPSGSVPPIRSSVSAGDDCTWLERDLEVTGADGQRLVCVGDGSSTRWVTED